MTVIVVEEQNVITLDIEEPGNIQLAANSEVALFSSLGDVEISSPSVNDTLKYDGNKWINV